jgi:ribosomal-protein-alanine N-acetyltransferase
LRVEDGADPDIVLRPLTRRDRRQWVRLRQDNAMWLRPWDATRPEGELPSVRFRSYVAGLDTSARAGHSLPFAIQVDGVLAGAVTLSTIVQGSFRSGTVGYWLARSQTGRGTMVRSLACLIDYAFDEVGLHRVEVNVRPENLASLAVVERLGFRSEGMRLRLLHIDGAWRDHLSFAVTVEDLAGGRMVDRIRR